MGCGSSSVKNGKVASDVTALFIIGPPGSIKAMKGDTKLGRRLKAAIEAKTKEDTAAREKQHKTDARLCNDAGINADVVAWYLGDQVGKSAGWCLDGFPSTEEEAKLLKDRGIPVSKLIVIDTPDEDLIRLAVGRRIDLESHTIFHLEGLGGWEKPPDEVKSRLVQRGDDMEAKVKATLEEYHEKLDGVDKLFEEVLRVSGSLEVEEALGKIKEFAGLMGRFDASAVGEEKKDDVENGGKGADKDEAHGGGGGKVEEVKEGGVEAGEEVGTPRGEDGQEEAKAGGQDGQEEAKAGGEDGQEEAKAGGEDGQEEAKAGGEAGRDGERQEQGDVQGEDREVQGKGADENEGEEKQ